MFFEVPQYTFSFYMLHHRPRPVDLLLYNVQRDVFAIQGGVGEMAKKEEENDVFSYMLGSKCSRAHTAELSSFVTVWQSE